LRLIQRCRDLEILQRSLIEERNIMVDFLREIGSAFSDSLQIDDLLTIVLRTAKRITDANAGVIYLVEDDGNMSARVIEGLFPPMVEVGSNTETKWTSKQKYIHDIIKSYPVHRGEGILGKVLEDGRAVCLDSKDINTSQLIPRYKSDFLRIKSLMVVPLKLKNRVLGVMAVVNKRYHEVFRPQELALLESLAEQAAVALINARLSIQLAEQKQLEWELRVASDIQNLLIPKKIPPIHGYELAAISQPVRSLGGDYYDIVKLDYDRYGIIIADVSGKGVPGAITIAIFRSLFRNYAVRFESPAKVLVEINNWLYGEMQEDMFITATYAILYPKEGRLVWSRAGHEPILYYSKKEEAIHAFSGMGVMMGMTFGKDFDSFLEENELCIGSGDLITLYTDGVIEAQNKAGCEFGRDNLCQVIRANADKKPPKVLQSITSQVSKFSGLSNFTDDITLLILKRL
jgi:sigma-B regulation protein RsbU (phosphoserine phosphatase)